MYALCANDSKAFRMMTVRMMYALCANHSKAIQMMTVRMMYALCTHDSKAIRMRTVRMMYALLYMQITFLSRIMFFISPSRNLERDRLRSTSGLKLSDNRILCKNIHSVWSLYVRSVCLCLLPNLVCFGLLPPSSLSLSIASI